MHRSIEQVDDQSEEKHNMVQAYTVDQELAWNLSGFDFYFPRR